MAAQSEPMTPGGVARVADEDDLRTWPLDRLADHIVSTHHRYVRAELPAAVLEVDALVERHGEHQPELKKVAALLDELGRDLLQHMAKEELVLFPYLRELESGDAREGQSPFGTVGNPIRMMEREHVEAGRLLDAIRALTGDYRLLPAGDAACEAAWRRLEAFERDLHQHIHLENNILFPRAQERERALWRS